MKKSKLFLAPMCLALIFVACTSEPDVKTVIVDFENVKVNSLGISDSTSFKSGICEFSLIDGQFWNGGIVCSSKQDSVTAGYENQYSAITAKGAASSSKYGVVYAPGSFAVLPVAGELVTIKSIMLTNSTYAYKDMKYGSQFGKKFSTGDWFKVIITGYRDGNTTGTVEYYLSDFRNGNTFMLKNWEKVDLSSLGSVDKITFTFDSTDKSGGWLNTPSYACIDNIEFTEKSVTE